MKTNAVSSLPDLESRRSSSRTGSSHPSTRSRDSKQGPRRLRKYEQLALLEVQKENEHLFAHLKQILTRPVALAPQAGRRPLHMGVRRAEAEQILTENQRLFQRLNSQKPSIAASELREDFMKHQKLQQRLTGQQPRSQSCPRSRLESGWRARMMNFQL